jgi:Dyp-type peroxidase family
VTSLDLADVQGLVARGYGNLKSAAFLLLALDEPAAARRWLGETARAVTSADERPGDRALHLALTSSGLARLGLPRDTLAQFSNEFVTGMATAHRTRLLGDAEESAPGRWDWGGPAAQRVDAALLLYARDDEQLRALEDERTNALDRRGVTVVRRLGTSDLDDTEPFGFRDGISQPFVEGLPRSGPPETTVRAGEFLLGYPNEYGHYTDRPLLREPDDPGGVLPRDAEGSGRPDLGRNGSYLVLRQLHQDVSGFWRFVDGAAGGEAAARTRLAAKMVGRWPSGAPLTLAPEHDEPARAQDNDFAYHEHDPRGVRCPVGSHIRRSNPRDSLDPRPGTAASWAVNRRHRLLRRGREYGPPLPLERALAGDDGAERGLHFICLNANIARQFEFVSHTWLNNPKFDRLYDDADPLVAPSLPHGGTFTIPTDGVRERVTGLPRFVTVRGGAYFFLPGLAALRYLAGLDAGNVSSPVGS